MAYTTAWDEGRVLDYFWAMVRSDADRVELLHQLAGIAIRRPEEWDADEVRFGMAMATLRLTADQCFACRNGDHHLYWHHIIQVQHGGSNDVRNFVRVCHACHRRVHPWLPAPTTLENRRGWVAIGDIAVRAFDKLTAWWTKPTSNPHVLRERQDEGKRWPKD